MLNSGLSPSQRVSRIKVLHTVFSLGGDASGSHRWFSKIGQAIKHTDCFLKVGSWPSDDSVGDERLLIHCISISLLSPSQQQMKAFWGISSKQEFFT